MIWDQIHRRWAPLLWAGLGSIASCATAPSRPELPALPPPRDPGALLGPAPAALPIPPHVRRYDDTPVRTGQCPGLPPGMLVSPAVYAERANEASEAKRLRLEVGALERVRADERKAALDLEQACRARAAELEAEVARAELLARWKVAAVFVAGGVIGALAAFAVSKPIVR